MASKGLCVYCYFLLFFIAVLSDFCKCQQPAIYFKVTEGSANEFIGNISSSDYIRTLIESSPEIVPLIYSIPTVNNPADISFFKIEADTGVLTTAKALDREDNDDCHNNVYCSVVLQVKVEGQNALETPFIEIEIEDINDNAPEFESSSISFQITEGSPIGTGRDLPDATDSDSPDYNVDLEAYVLQSDVQGLFQLQRDDEGLKLVLQQSIDRETRDSYSLTLVAYDKGEPERFSGSLDIEISVNDVNDEEPIFTEPSYETEVREDLPIDSSVIQVEAEDKDLGPSGEVKYKFSQLTDIRDGETFGIREETGLIYLKTKLDFETTNQFELVVEAVDKGSSPMTSSASVLVRVTDVNDEIPKIRVDTLTKKANAEVQENLPAGALVALVIVVDTDIDENGKVDCSLEHQSFQLQPLSEEKQFKIVTMISLDREDQSSYSLQISCSDFGSPSLTGSGMVNVTVLDDNDHDPEFEKSDYAVSVPENKGIGAFITKVSATDKDLGENGTVVYSLSDPAAEKYVAIDRETGDLKTAKRLDYEEVQQFTVLVKASDTGKTPRTSVTAVQISVLDENDQPPEFLQGAYTFDIKENNNQLPTFVGTVLAHDSEAAGNNAFVYSLGQFGDGSSFSIDSITGRITAIDTLDREVKEKYTFLAYATDQQDGTLSSSVSVTVNVEDENDNFPQILYPVGNNQTITISNKVPVGYLIMHVSAQDADVGPNADLSYFISDDTGDSSKTSRFVIDNKTGEITTNKDLSSDEYEITTSKIVIKDGGLKPKSSTATITIIVDSSQGTNSNLPSTEASKGSKNNTVIIAVITTLTVVIVVILVIAILCLRRRFNSKSSSANKNPDFKTPSPGKNKAPHMTAVPQNTDSVEKNESFSISNASGNIPIMATQPNSEAQQGMNASGNSPGTGQGLDTTGSDDSLPSNADSGKGPSEGEAEIGVMRVDSDRQRPVHRKLPPAPLDLSNARPDMYHRNNQYMDHHRHPQSAGPYPRQPQYNNHFQFHEYHHNPTRQTPDPEFMSRSYPNSPNHPESEYVPPSFDNWDPQYYEMRNMQQTMHQHTPGYFRGTSVPMGNNGGMDSGYHSQNNGPFSQSAPNETVFQNHWQPHNGIQADSGYSSQSGGFGQNSPKAWETALPFHPNLPRQYSEPAHSQNIYYTMEGVPEHPNQSSVDV